MLHVFPVQHHGDRQVSGGGLGRRGCCLFAAPVGVVAQRAPQCVVVSSVVHRRAGGVAPSDVDHGSPGPVQLRDVVRVGVPDLDRAFSAVVLGSEFDGPAAVGVPRSRRHAALQPGERVHAHAGRVLAHDRAAVPLAAAEPQQHRGVGDAAAVVGHGEALARRLDVDARRAGPACVLQQLGHDVERRAVEEASDPLQRTVVDRRADASRLRCRRLVECRCRHRPCSSRLGVAQARWSWLAPCGWPPGHCCCVIRRILNAQSGGR